MKIVYNSTECAFLFFLYPPSPFWEKKCCTCVCTLNRKWWISSCASCHVGDMPSDMALAPFLLSQIFDSDGKTSFPHRSQPEKQKKVIEHVPYVYIYIYWEENWFPFNRLFIPHNTEAAWDDFYTAHWSRAKCYVLYTIPRTSRGRERESFNLETDLSYRIR